MSSYTTIPSSVLQYKTLRPASQHLADSFVLTAALLLLGPARASGSLQADAESSARLRANRAWQDAELATYNAKSWFWWASSQQRVVVGKAKGREREAAQAARKLNKQHERLLSDAKAQLGLWSEVLARPSLHRLSSCNEPRPAWSYDAAVGPCIEGAQDPNCSGHSRLVGASALLALQVGLDEGRKLFWSSFNTGKVPASAALPMLPCCLW